MLYSEEQHRAAVIADGRFQDIGNLPSNFIPYANKKLMIRPFTVKEMRLVSKAAVLKETTHLLRAIDLVIDQDVLDLSIGDYYYILMWLRIHSMPKTPYIVEWHCPDYVWVEKESRRRLFKDDPATAEIRAALDADRLLVEQKLKALENTQIGKTHEIEKCTTHNSEIIHMTDVKIISLEDHFEALPDPRDAGVVTDDVEFDFPRVRHLDEIQEALKEPELRMLVGPAQWIKGPTLAEKIAILERQPNLDLFDMASGLNEQVVHGIRETAKLTCRGCATSLNHVLALDALSFFR